MKQNKSITVSLEAKLVATALKIALLGVFLFAFTPQKFSSQLREQLGLPHENTPYTQEKKLQTQPVLLRSSGLPG